MKQFIRKPLAKMIFLRILVCVFTAMSTMNPSHAKGSRDHWSTPAFGAQGERLQFLRDYYCFDEGRAGQREIFKRVVFPKTANVSHAEVFLSGFNMWYTQKDRDHEISQSWVDAWIEKDPFPCPEEFGPDKERWCVDVKLKYVMKDENAGDDDDFNRACIGFTVVALTRQALTREFWISRSWEFRHGEGDIIESGVRLLPNGTISGINHPNESSWGLEDGTLVFYNPKGVPCTRFTSVRYENGKVIVTGRLRGGEECPGHKPVVIHVLAELEKL